MDARGTAAAAADCDCEGGIMAPDRASTRGPFEQMQSGCGGECWSKSKRCKRVLGTTLGE